MDTTHDLNAIMAEINERGYAIIPSVITPAKADAVRAVLDDLLNQEATEATRAAKTQRVGRIAVKHPLFIDLLTHPLIVALWKTYLGEDIMCSSWSANTAFPGYGTYGWHTDYPYWSLKPPWPPGNFAGQTIWLLDDFSADNGGTGVLPYSHLKRQPPDTDVSNVWIEDGDILTGTRGSVMVMHAATWHTARPNITQQPRSALLGMYMMPWFIPQEDMHGQLDELDSPSPLVQQLLGARQHRPRNVGG